jgi:hypothetical protein
VLHYPISEIRGPNIRYDRIRRSQKTVEPRTLFRVPFNQNCQTLRPLQLSRIGEAWLYNLTIHGDLLNTHIAQVKWNPIDLTTP